jgi:hypothetical protein
MGTCRTPMMGTARMTSTRIKQELSSMCRGRPDQRQLAFRAHQVCLLRPFFENMACGWKESILLTEGKETL